MQKEENYSDRKICILNYSRFFLLDVNVQFFRKNDRSSDSSSTRQLAHIVENFSRYDKVMSSVWSDDEDDGSAEYEEEVEEEEEEVVSVIESSVISTEAILEESDSEIIARVEVHTYATCTSIHYEIMLNL